MSAPSQARVLALLGALELWLPDALAVQRRALLPSPKYFSTKLICRRQPGNFFENCCKGYLEELLANFLSVLVLQKQILPDEQDVKYTLIDVTFITL